MSRSESFVCSKTYFFYPFLSLLFLLFLSFCFFLSSVFSIFLFLSIFLALSRKQKDPRIRKRSPSCVEIFFVKTKLANFFSLLFRHKYIQNATAVSFTQTNPFQAFFITKKTSYGKNLLLLKLSCFPLSLSLLLWIPFSLFGVGFGFFLPFYYFYLFSNFSTRNFV